MKTLIAFITVLLTAATAFALDINPFEGPKPIAVLIQTDPWLMVIGSDTPEAAIYEDGQVIQFKREKDKPPHYVHTQLSAPELDEVKKRILSAGNYSELKSAYNLAPGVFDLPETKIYLDLGETRLTTVVYGLMLPDTHLLASSSFPTEEKADVLPATLKNLHHYLTNLSFSAAKEWVPKYVEVMIWPYDYAPDESIHWPEEWPGLDSPNTLKREEGYSIFFPGGKMKQLGEFLMTRKPKGAVEIGGKKWAVSGRYTFPGEPVWFKAFQAEKEKQN